MNSENVIKTVIESVISGIMTGIFTVIGVLITIKAENVRKEKERKMIEIDDKPRFRLQKGELKSNTEDDISVFIAPFEVIKNDNGDITFNYDKKLYDDEDIIYKDFFFENIGKSFVTEFYFVSNNKKHVSVFDFSSRKAWMNTNFIRYDILYDKSCIEVGDCLKIRLSYKKEFLHTNLFSADFSIYYRDEYGNYWEQAFFPMDEKLYEPQKSNWKELRKEISTEIALECFENPVLW